jgi:hypothetical protein
MFLSLLVIPNHPHVFSLMQSLNLTPKATGNSFVHLNLAWPTFSVQGFILF